MKTATIIVIIALVLFLVAITGAILAFIKIAYDIIKYYLDL